MKRPYRALRIIGTVYKVLGVIVAVLTIVVVVGMFGMSVFGGAMGHMWGSDGAGRMMGGLLGGAFGALGVLLYGGVIAVSLYGIGEGVYLLLALEANTRETSAALKALAPQAGTGLIGGSSPGSDVAPAGAPPDPEI